MPRLDVCTPWYPTPYDPVVGSYVTSWTRLALPLASPVRVVHTHEWPGGNPEIVRGWRAPLDEVVGALGRSERLDVASVVGTITRVPSLIETGMGVLDRAEAGVRDARAALGTLPGDLVHGHVGYLGGLVGARLADPGARVVVTEHSTGLRGVLEDPRGLELYAEVLERAHRLTCVSTPVRQLILDHLPQFADTVVVMPNPVDFEPPHQRRDTPERLDRWVFVGGVIERKGVVRLVEAFIRFAADRPAATLDMFGQGPLVKQLQDRLADVGLAERVTWHPALTHDALLAALPAFDVLLAPSVYETFHLAVPEAIAAGLPVVVTRSVGPEEAVGDAADLVGRFVDVNDNPDELLDAVLDVERNLASLDIPAGRARLAARYGPDAVTDRLAELYGVERRTPSAPVVPTPTRPERVTLLARRNWRHYAASAEASAAQRAGLGVRVVTDDPAAVASASGAEQITTASLTAALTPAAVPSPAKRLRGALGQLRRGNPRAALAKLVPPPADPSLTVGAKGDACVLVDASSAADALAVLRAHPDADLRVELDRGSLRQSPPDAD